MPSFYHLSHGFKDLKVGDVDRSVCTGRDINSMKFDTDVNKSSERSNNSKDQ